MGQMTVDWLVGGLNFVAGCLCISGAIVNFQMMRESGASISCDQVKS